MSLPIKPDLQRTFTSAMQFYHRDFEQLRKNSRIKKARPE